MDWATAYAVSGCVAIIVAVAAVLIAIRFWHH